MQKCDHTATTLRLNVEFGKQVQPVKQSIRGIFWLPRFAFTGFIFDETSKHLFAGQPRWLFQCIIFLADQGTME